MTAEDIEKLRQHDCYGAFYHALSRNRPAGAGKFRDIFNRSPRPAGLGAGQNKAGLRGVRMGPFDTEQRGTQSAHIVPNRLISSALIVACEFLGGSERHGLTVAVEQQPE